MSRHLSHRYFSPGSLAVVAVMILDLGLACRTPEENDPFEADCRAWCSKRAECGVVADTGYVIARCTDSCVDAKELDAPDYGQVCVEAYAQAMACLAEISCEDYAALTLVPKTKQPCAEALDPIYNQCPGVFLAPDANPPEQGP